MSKRMFSDERQCPYGVLGYHWPVSALPCSGPAHPDAWTRSGSGCCAATRRRWTTSCRRRRRRWSRRWRRSCPRRSTRSCFSFFVGVRWRSCSCCWPCSWSAFSCRWPCVWTSGSSLPCRTCRWTQSRGLATGWTFCTALKTNKEWDCYFWCSVMKKRIINQKQSLWQYLAKRTCQISLI